jgi:hypothetical protein
MKPFRKGTLIRFISLFYTPSLKNKFRRYIPLSSTKLNNEIHRNYKDIINGLLDYGLIVLGKKYSIGNHNNHYGLADKYYDCKDIIQVILKPRIETELARKQRILKERRLIQDRKEGRNYELTKEEKLSSHYGLLTRWFYHPDLEFNIDLANKHLTKIHNSKAKKSTMQYMHAFTSVARFYHKDWSLKFDKNGRLHTNLTMLPSKFRPCISFNGMPLIGVDVSNTQPLLLASLCDIHWLGILIRRGLIQIDYNMFLEFKAHIESGPLDLIEYQQLVSDGKLYEYLLSIYPQFSRKVIKLNLLKIINDEGYSESKNRELVRSAFKQTFPTIYRLLQLLKSVTYKQSSKVLMQIESSRFVVWFTQEFYYKKENDHIPLFTIHDCFYTTPDHIDFVRSELLRYYQSYCGEFLPLKLN